MRTALMCILLLICGCVYSRHGSMAGSTVEISSGYVPMDRVTMKKCHWELWGVLPVGGNRADVRSIEQEMTRDKGPLIDVVIENRDRMIPIPIVFPTENCVFVTGTPITTGGE